MRFIEFSRLKHFKLKIIGMNNYKITSPHFKSQVFLRQYQVYFGHTC